VIEIEFFDRLIAGDPADAGKPIGFTAKLYGEDSGRVELHGDLTLDEAREQHAALGESIRRAEFFEKRNKRKKGADDGG
jgi:hypothetical protein